MEEVHANLGPVILLGSLIVGAWALLRAWRGGAAGMPLAIATAAVFIVLTFQILIGADLFAQGHRPAEGVLNALHMAMPVIALVGGLLAVWWFRRAPARAYAIASFLIFVLAAGTYAIGESG